MIFICAYDQSLAEEGRAFQRATPMGMAEYSINNPDAAAQLVIGEYYYFDITPRSKDAG